MKNKLAVAFFVLFAIAALIFSVSNIVPPAQAGVIYGTVTYVPGGLPPINDIFKLYGHTYCLYEESNCSVVWEPPI